MLFNARFQYTHSIVSGLMTVEGARRLVDVLPLPPAGVLGLKQVARQKSSRASVAIEGNPLNLQQAFKAIAGSDRSPSEHQQEVRNYWRALEWLEDWNSKKNIITEEFIKKLHSIIVVQTGGGRRREESQYRHVDCPVVDTATGVIEYGPPEPKDVHKLMADLVAWLNLKEVAALPGPIRAALLAHRFVSIHPFNDGNGRTTRALATAELWRSGYYMQGFLSVEELYDERRNDYYDNLQMGLPWNFYDGRHDPDHTPWVEYFVSTLSEASEKIRIEAERLYQTQAKESAPWSELSRRQQQLLVRLTTRALDLGTSEATLTPGEIMEWFDVSKPTAHEWLKEWVAEGFVEPFNPGERTRYYILASNWRAVVEEVKRHNA